MGGFKLAFLWFVAAHALDLYVTMQAGIEREINPVVAAVWQYGDWAFYSLKAASVLFVGVQLWVVWRWGHRPARCLYGRAMVLLNIALTALVIYNFIVL